MQTLIILAMISFCNPIERMLVGYEHMNNSLFYLWLKPHLNSALARNWYIYVREQLSVSNIIQETLNISESISPSISNIRSAETQNKSESISP